MFNTLKFYIRRISGVSVAVVDVIVVFELLQTLEDDLKSARVARRRRTSYSFDNNVFFPGALFYFLLFKIRFVYLSS